MIRQILRGSFLSMNFTEAAVHRRSSSENVF